MTQTLKPVRSLMELEILAKSNARYLNLAIRAAINLGGDPVNLSDALRWLRLNAVEVSESDVVAEVNWLI